MIRTLRTLGHLTAALALPLLTPLPAYAAVPDSLPAQAAPAADHVIFIGLDGFDYDYLGEVPTPNIDQLVKRGSVTESTGVMQSITNPSWSSIATGAWPERHLNTAYVYDPVSHTARGQERDLAVPTIAEAVRAQGGTVMSSQWFIVQNHGTAYGDPEGIYTQPGGDCSRRVDDIVKVIKGEPVKSGATMVTAPKIPDLMAVYCDALDAIGHEGGDHDQRIPDALADLDAQIGRIVQATKDAGIFGRTTFVITGDHGMTTFTKGFGTQVIDAIAKAGYKAELLGTGKTPKPDTDAVIVVGGIGSLHLVGAAKNDPQAVAKIKAALEATPHVSQVFDKAAQQAMHMSPRFGELVIEPESGWSIGGDPAGGVAGRHGATTELHIPLVLSGAGVLPGLHPVDPHHVDIAPTIAALLGIQPPLGAQGRVLSESIRD
ncbi:alkaline phosphatase family protein [Micromonospora sp. NPDC023814]|uniref:alkaline phosphatase family protein n=1 Tax=Micromonospora sp. NPDC023814 TaxID=3154596 RepID=UPI0033D2C812